MEKQTLYYPSENVSHIYKEATREEFYNCFLECTDWYRDAVQDGFDGTIEDYADFLCDTELIEVEKC